MKRALPIVLLFCLAFAAGPALAADAPKASGVKGLDAAWTKAVLAGDSAAVAALLRGRRRPRHARGRRPPRGGKAIAESLAGLAEGHQGHGVRPDATAHYRTAGHLSRAGAIGR